MQKRFVETGGARIGWFNATWPFAQLSANEDNLIVNVFGRTYTFTPREVLVIERYKERGIRIRHDVAEYPDKIIFWGNPDKILGGIWDSGFTVDAR